MCTDCVCQFLNIDPVTDLKKAMHYICGVKEMMVGSIVGQDRPSFFAKFSLFKGSNRNRCLKHNTIH
jgi:hypothetical protein